MEQSVLSEKLYHPGGRTNHERLSTIVLFVVIQLQVFRRLSAVAYAGVLLAAYVYWLSSIHYSRKTRMRRSTLLFLACYLSFPILSLLTCSWSEYLTAIVRYGALMPLLIVSATNSRIIYDYLTDIVKTYFYIVVLSALLLIYQVFFGRISFFVDPSERAGFVRYGSLLGSITTYGGSAAVAIMFLHNFNILRGWRKVVSEVLILIGGVLCLSKASIVNLAMGYVLILLFRPSEGRTRTLSLNRILAIALMLAATGCILAFLVKYTIIGTYYNKIIQYTFYSSHNVADDLLKRVNERPFAAFEYYDNPLVYYLFFGVGFKGYAGVLGLSQYPMCHNNFFDIVLAQGLVALLALLGIYLGAFFAELKRNDACACLVKKLVPYKLVNMLAGTGTYLTSGGMLALCLIIAVYHRDPTAPTPIPAETPADDMKTECSEEA